MAISPTRGADDIQRDTAVPAETAVWTIIGRAVGASHGSTSSRPARLLSRRFLNGATFALASTNTNVYVQHNLIF